MIRRADIIAAARECLDTKFHHQGRLVGVGIDCIGVMVHPAKRLGIPHIDCTTYRARPDGITLIPHLERNLERIAVGEARPGDVLCFWWVRPNLPHHLGLLTDRGLLHAYAGVRKVVEHELTDDWRERIHSAWRYRGVEPWQQSDSL